MDSPPVIQRIRKKCDREGIAATALRSLEVLHLVPTARSLDFFIRTVAPNEALPAAVDPSTGIEMREWSESAFIANPPRLASELQDRVWAMQQLRTGARMFAASLEGNIVAWVWFSLGSAALGAINRPQISLPSGFAYCHGVVTAAPFRGQGIASTLKQLGIAAITPSGIKYVLTAVYPSNMVGQRWHRDVLREPYWGRITHVRWMGCEWWLKKLSPTGKAHPSIFDSFAACEQGKQTVS